MLLDENFFITKQDKNQKKLSFYYIKYFKAI